MKSLIKLRHNASGNPSSVTSATKDLPANSSLEVQRTKWENLTTKGLPAIALASAGEVATLMTVITMGIMLVGVIVGVQLGSQQTQTTASQAQTLPTATPTPLFGGVPTPTGMTPASSCFRISSGTCSADFTYICDPIIRNAWLQDKNNANQKMYLPDGLPVALDIKGELIGVNIDPKRVYLAPNQGLNGKIVVSIKSSGGGSLNYKGYNTRPDWASGVGPVDFYIQYQTRSDKNAGNNKTYIEKASMRGGCVTPSITPTLTVTPPIPSNTPTPVAPLCGRTCKTNSECGEKYVCFKGDLPVQQEVGVCRLAACSNQSDCKCRITLPPPTRTPSKTPTPTKPAPVCNSTCQTNADCGGSLICHQGACRAEACREKSDCTCELTKVTEECTIKSVSFVEECVDANCTEKRPIAAADKDIPGAIPTWGVLNDLQYGAPQRPQPAPFDTLTDRRSVLADTIIPIVAHVYEQPVVRFATDGVKDILARTNSANVERLPFKSGDAISARLYYDKGAYQLFEKRINTCRWNKVGNNEGTGWKCNNSQGPQPIDRGQSDTNNEQSTIDGIKLACNREYEFGWTLQRCTPLDIFFVLDTSNSMSEPDQNGQRKIDLAKQSLISYINATNLDLHRAALITFNKEAKTVGLTHDRSTLISAVNNAPQAQYTRIDLGLQEAYKQILETSPKDNQRLVVLVSDGLPDPAPEQRSAQCQGENPAQSCFQTWISDITAKADQFKSFNRSTNRPEALLITIGLGNPTSQFLPGTRLDEYLKMWASNNPIRPLEKLTFNTTTNPNLTLKQLFTGVTALVDQCAATLENYSQTLALVDINDDGIVNTIDYFMILDVYLSRGQNIPEDINRDGLVNSLDLSMVIERIGISIVN